MDIAEGPKVSNGRSACAALRVRKALWRETGGIPEIRSYYGYEEER